MFGLSRRYALVEHVQHLHKLEQNRIQCCVMNNKHVTH